MDRGGEALEVVVEEEDIGRLGDRVVAQEALEVHARAGSLDDRCLSDAHGAGELVGPRREEKDARAGVMRGLDRFAVIRYTIALGAVIQDVDHAP